MRGQAEAEQKRLVRQAAGGFPRGMIDVDLGRIHDARSIARRALAELLLLAVQAEPLVEPAEILDEGPSQPEVRSRGEAAFDIPLLVEVPRRIDKGATRHALEHDRDVPGKDVDRLCGEAGETELEPVGRREAVCVGKRQDRGAGGADAEVASRGETDVIGGAYDKGAA